jgi:hypothetical protein
MPIEPLAEDPFEILVGRIIDGTLPATPEGIALVAWVCDFVATDPHFVTNAVKISPASPIGDTGLKLHGRGAGCAGSGTVGIGCAWE